MMPLLTARPENAPAAGPAPPAARRKHRPAANTDSPTPGRPSSRGGGKESGRHDGAIGQDVEGGRAAHGGRGKESGMQGVAPRVGALGTLAVDGAGQAVGGAAPVPPTGSSAGYDAGRGGPSAVCPTTPCAVRERCGKGWTSGYDAWYVALRIGATEVS